MIPFSHGDQFLENYKDQEISVLVGDSVWNVVIKYSSDAYRLGRGWRKFVKDNDVKIDDLLLFEYLVSASYDVTIFRAQ